MQFETANDSNIRRETTRPVVLTRVLDAIFYSCTRSRSSNEIYKLTFTMLKNLTYLATDTIFKANDLLRQNPAPPVANQNDIFDCKRKK